MTLEEKQMIFSKNISALFAKICSTPGYSFTFGEAYRTPEQAEIYAKEGKGIVNSLHCKRLALDINLFLGGVYHIDYGDYKIFGEYWKSLHPFNRWGGDFHPLIDSNHFEMQDL